MQRKNNLLNFSTIYKRTSGSTLTSGKLFFIKKVPSRQARGFAMIMAVIVMIVIASITMFTLMQTSQTVKRTADLYLYEQAELHTKSAIEYTLFEIARTGCVNNTLNFTLDAIYDVNVSTKYVYTGLSPKTNVDGTLDCIDFIGGVNAVDNIQTDEQNGSVLMDIVVTVKPTDTGTDTIRYTRRTIQKL